MTAGIFVQALKGFPGVRSRRWCAEEKDDKTRKEKLLYMMQTEKSRETNLVTAFVIVSKEKNSDQLLIVDNLFYLAEQDQGENGFGYDGILIPNEEIVRDSVNRGVSEERIKQILEEKLTIADLTQKEKNAINNRGRIAKQIKELFDNGTI